METVTLNRADVPKWLTDAIDGGKEVHNAPRPLLGDLAPGMYAGVPGAIHGLPSHGVFFVAIDPSDVYADAWRQSNERMDARLVVLVTDEEVRAAWEDRVRSHGYDPEKVAARYGGWKRHARVSGLVPSKDPQA